jgi:hypothetical protein
LPFGVITVPLSVSSFAVRKESASDARFLAHLLESEILNLEPGLRLSRSVFSLGLAHADP